MRTVRLTLFTIVFAFYLITAQAVAASPEPGYTVDVSPYGLANQDKDTLYTEDAPKQWREMLPVAETIWGRSPKCPNGISMKTMTVEEGSQAIAKAVIGGCDIWVDISAIKGHENKYYRERCLIIAHEYGHLLGEEHSEKGLMGVDTSANDELDIPQCGPQPHEELQLMWILLALFILLNGVQLLWIIPLLLAL